MDERVDLCMSGQMRAQMDSLIDEWTWADGQTDGKTNEWMDMKMQVWLNGRMVGWTDGWMSGQMDG